MIDNSILRAKLEKQLAKTGLDEAEKERLIAELNFFADFLIDLYLTKKANG